MDIVLGLIISDVEMALASQPRHVDNASNQEVREEERQKEDLMAEIEELQGKHEELLASISGL